MCEREYVCVKEREGSVCEREGANYDYTVTLTTGTCT